MTDNPSAHTSPTPREPPPVVSILMGAYNAAGFISETIASALAQTFSQFELLVVDDGSSDSTLAVAREWEQRDRRVRVFTQKNGGVARARNTAIGHARGRFFALLDSDDIWLPGYLAAQMSMFERFPAAGVVTCNARNLGGPDDGALVLPGAPAPRQISLQEMLEDETAVCILSVIRREVYDAIGGFDGNLRSNEDYDYWIRAALAGAVFIYNPEPLGFYRRRPDSLSANQIGMFVGIRRVLAKARSLCTDNGAAVATIDRQIARFEREEILARAKRQLLAREFAAARRSFEELHATQRNLASWCLARASRCAPLLLWAYRIRLAARKRRVAAARLLQPG